MRGIQRAEGMSERSGSHIDPDLLLLLELLALAAAIGAAILAAGLAALALAASAAVCTLGGWNLCNGGDGEDDGERK